MSACTFLMLPGAGSDEWYWHRVVPLLEEHGHHAVPVDLPSADPSAGLREYTDAAVAALASSGAPTDRVVVVAQSMGGFTAPLVCTRIPVQLMVLVAAMVPLPGEPPGEWWANTGHEDARRRAALRDGRDPDEIVDDMFLHDVPDHVVAESMSHVHDQSGAPFERPWPLAAWPDVPTRFLLCRDDRFFPAEFQRRVVRERLGIVPDEMRGGHLPALAHPVELADHLLAYVLEFDAAR